MTSDATFAAAIVVKYVTLYCKAVLLIEKESLMDNGELLVVLTIMSILPFLIISTICGLPSRTLFTLFTLMLFSNKKFAVPLVAKILKSFSAKVEIILKISFLSSSLTLTKTLPLLGIS